MPAPMLNPGTIITAALLWLAVLFALALLAERRPQLLAGQWKHVYALSLAVHCTSWSFYGTVTQAARHGWPVPPTFVGAIIVYALGIGFLLKLVRVARASNTTSLADFIATRLGKDAWLAATITLVAVIGLVPYIALQLQAITLSFSTLSGHFGTTAQAPPLWRDEALYLALALALFTMLFGTRRASTAEHNRALVLAIAFESVFKLVAMLALGACVWWGLGGAWPQSVAPAPPPVAAMGDFIPFTLLGAMTIFIMPHQFHIGVVECRDDAGVRIARWQFPLYLLLISLPTLPLAGAGMALFGDAVPSDMYVLAIPMALGQSGTALLAFLGGLSAATGMVIVSTLSLSLMIGNHWFAPGLLRGTWSRGQEADHRGSLLRLRRVGIVTVMLLGWGYSRLVGSHAALADVGAVSFSALVTPVPALVFALWFPRTPPRAVLAGVLAAFAIWIWAMLLPALAESGDLAPHWLHESLLGQHWLAPESLLGLTGWSRLGRATVASLFVGSLTTVLLAGWLGYTQQAPMPGSTLDTLRRAGRRFLPAHEVDALLQDAPTHGPVPEMIEQRLERELSAVLGSASARLLLDAARREAGPDLETVAAIMRETSADVRFNQRLLQAALENMSQGISVVDADLQLVAWNRRYAQLFGYPPHLLQVGQAVGRLIGHNLERSLIGAVNIESERAKRLAHMRAGTPYLSERRFPDGTVVEIRGNPMPSGGFVATFTDVTGFRQAEAALKRSNETLEQRVLDRTARLEQARQEAERANAAKSRFLTAVGHDLLQPVHAAQLFVDALQRPLAGHTPMLEQLRGALDSIHALLASLLDISRLDADGFRPEPRALPLAEVLDPLASEFAALAEANGLAFHYRNTRCWVQTDPALLRRVVQNFLANAVRYTVRGGVLLGVRREGLRVRIEIHDTGPGIAQDQQQRMFEEFRRGDNVPGQGLGLGLSIAERLAALLDAPLSLRSTLGRGTVFSVAVLASAPQALVPEATISSTAAPARLLVVDNDPQALAALSALLHSWGHEVATAANEAAALAALEDAPANAWLLDYHLDHDFTGLSLYAHLCERFSARPSLILSADTHPTVHQSVQEHGLTLLQKPVHPLALKSVLGRLLAGATG